MILRFLRWISHWPLGWVHGLGAVLGWLAWLLSPGYRRVLAQNAARAGVDRASARASIAHAGRMALEVPWMWFREPHRPLGDLVRWDGAELVEQALQAQRGLLLLTPHVGAFEVSGRAYAERFGHRRPMVAMYRPARHAWLAELQTHARNAPGMQAVPNTLAGVRQLLRALRQGDTLGMLPDQVPPEGQGVWAEFFGQPAYTMTLAGRLARQTGCTVLLTWCERLPQAQGFVLHYAPLPEALPEGGDELATAQAINRAMEWTVRRHPEQYLWGYKRYKKPRRLPAVEKSA